MNENYGYLTDNGKNDDHCALSKALVSMRLDTFIENLSNDSGVNREDIVISFCRYNEEVNMLQFYVLSTSKKCFFNYHIYFPYDFSKHENVGSVLKDNPLCYFTVGDIMRFSEETYNHPKDLFSKAIMKDLIKNKDYDKQKVLIKNQNN